MYNQSKSGNNSLSTDYKKRRFQGNTSYDWNKTQKQTRGTGSGNSTNNNSTNNTGASAQQP